MAWSVAACLCVHVGSSGFLFVTATAVSLFLSFSCLSPSRARALGFDPTRPVDFFAVLAKTVCAAPRLHTTHAAPEITDAVPQKMAAVIPNKKQVYLARHYYAEITLSY